MVQELDKLASLRFLLIQILKYKRPTDPSIYIGSIYIGNRYIGYLGPCLSVFPLSEVINMRSLDVVGDRKSQISNPPVNVYPRK